MLRIHKPFISKLIIQLLFSLNFILFQIIRGTETKKNYATIGQEAKYCIGPWRWSDPKGYKDGRVRP